MIGISTSLPLPEAVDAIARRTPLGSSLSAAEWDLVPAEIRLRAMFSSRVECERLLQEFKDKIGQNIRVERSVLADGQKGAYMDRPRFIREMREYLDKSGYVTDPKHAGTLRDLSSRKRLELIWNMNKAQAQGYSRWKMDMDPAALAAFPVLEFVRLEPRVEIRQWPVIWAMHGGKFYGGVNPDYPLSPGRMMALRTDPIWPAINRFGVPWKPFDWGSGMGTRSVSREEARSLGITKKGDPPQVPLDMPFNRDAQASLAGIPQDRRMAIVDAMCGDVEIDGDVLRLLPQEKYDAMGGRPRNDAVSAPRFTRHDQPAPPLSHKPLTATVTSPDNAEAARGISLAAEVHGDGVLPQLAMGYRKIITGAAADYSPTVSAADVPQLRVSPLALDKAWAALHELGHFLDNHGLHTPSLTRLYASAGQPELAEVMGAIRNSAAFHQCLARARAANMPYWVKCQELFARAYAQWIAFETGDARLLETWKAIRNGEWEQHGVWKESQWNEPDFQETSDALDGLFTNLQWKSGQ